MISFVRLSCFFCFEKFFKIINRCVAHNISTVELAKCKPCSFNEAEIRRCLKTKTRLNLEKICANSMEMSTLLKRRSLQNILKLIFFKIHLQYMNGSDVSLFDPICSENNESASLANTGCRLAKWPI